MSFDFKIEGLQQFIAKAEASALLGGPLRRFFNSASITVQGFAREKAPVDTGHLRSSITYEVESAPIPSWAKIGTNVSYAAAMEYGTGLLSEAPDSSNARHWPPAQALSTWADRHGMPSGFVVAQAIGRRGGLKPRRYLRGGLDAALTQIRGFLSQLGTDIRTKWDG